MNAKSLQTQVKQAWQSTLRLRITLFFVVLTLLYGFIVWRINVLSRTEPTDTMVAAKTSKTSSPHIDKSLVDKITQLEDNNVNVKALFVQARQNPFHE